MKASLHRLFASTVVAALMAGCVPIPIPVSAAQVAATEAPLVRTTPAIASFDRQFAALRTAQGLQPLRSNAGLDAVALAHSRDMAAQGYLAHVNKSGRNAQARVRAAGVTNCGIGENIAQGQDSVEEVVAAWLASPGHRRNMLNRNYESYGIGRQGDTWTLVFALPC